MSAEITSTLFGRKSFSTVDRSWEYPVPDVSTTWSPIDLTKSPVAEAIGEIAATILSNL
jgi:hypothetical protein